MNNDLLININGYVLGLLEKILDANVQVKGIENIPFLCTFPWKRPEAVAISLRNPTQPFLADSFKVACHIELSFDDPPKCVSRNFVNKAIILSNDVSSSRYVFKERNLSKKIAVL